MISKTEATIEDLYKVEGKAEIVNGEIVHMSPTGFWPGRAAKRIVRSLDDHEGQHGGGVAVPDNVAFTVDLPHRKSFSPDAAWYTGDAESAGMRFLDGAPAFAVEVRSQEDYSPRAERRIQEKIDDYFAAGTIVVWDVDLLSPEVIRVYRNTDRANPTIYRRGESAEAEPAVPGWRFPVDRLF